MAMFLRNLFLRHRRGDCRIALKLEQVIGGTAAKDAPD
jgi:hypothetical protein